MTDKILLSHGSGGKKSQELFQNLFQPCFDNEFLNLAHDGAILSIDQKKLAFSTDTFVVNPVFFPGGDIGDLAVNGTVNDLSMCGATPVYLSAGFILEEGFELDKLRRIAESMAKAAKKAEVKLVTGDTKVVEKGKADGIFINTSGIGVINQDVDISPQNVRLGDAVILNGTIADHGIAVLSKREGIDIESDVVSDTIALNHLVSSMMALKSDLHVLRDPTRGGLAAVLNEIAASAGIGIEINEENIPVLNPVKAIASMLGIDPLYIANEGKLVAFVEEQAADRALHLMQTRPEGKNAGVIGKVVAEHPGQVVIKTKIGTRRILDMPIGERLPRIC